MDYSNPDYHKNRHGNISKSAENYISTVRLKKIMRQGKLKGKEEVLETGVGYGWNLSLFPQKVDGFDLINVITNDNVQFKAKENLKSDSYNFILCHHVIEHIESPLTFISEHLELLKKGGKMLIYLPIEKKTSWLPSKNDLDNHIYSWTPRTFFNLIKVSIKNCEIEDIGYQPFGFDRYFGELSHFIGNTISRFLQILALKLTPRYELYS